MEGKGTTPITDNSSNVHWGDKIALNTALAGTLVICLIAFFNMVSILLAD
jgi:hypothetical protein